MERLTLSNPISLPTAYSPALICFERERGWWITCNYPIVLKEKNMEKQKEYNLRCLLAKARTTWGQASDRFRQHANKRNKTVSDIFRHRSGTWKLYCRATSDVGSERVKNIKNTKTWPPLCSSSGESVVLIRYLVYVTLCRWRSSVQVWIEPPVPSKPAH
jgi:hypothetical protein